MDYQPWPTDPGARAQRVRRVRRALGLTSAKFARVLRFKPANAFQTMRRIEGGEMEVSGPVSALCDAIEAGWRPADFAAIIAARSC